LLSPDWLFAVADLYALDSTIYISSLRNANRLEAFKRFLLRSGTRIRLHAVVVMELRSGVRTEQHMRAIDALIAPDEVRGKTIVPSLEAYSHAGRALSALAVRENIDSGSALLADALIAASCREAGAVLVTDNVRHFAALQRQLRGFRFQASDDVM
jgi:predicted nucleic acid-binding protein